MLRLVFTYCFLWMGAPSLATFNKSLAIDMHDVLEFGPYVDLLLIVTASKRNPMKRTCVRPSGNLKYESKNVLKLIK